MEIERSIFSVEVHTLLMSKQRKSPENGDWKGFLLPIQCLLKYRNKENLLKMEIERFSPPPINKIAPPGNKENLLKMEIESVASGLRLFSVGSKKQRKSPENGDWKINAQPTPPSSPGWNKENLLKMEIESKMPHNSTNDRVEGNKENLLKMEIERWSKKLALLNSSNRNKENLLKMEIES